jgi:hypothetical protein
MNPALDRHKWINVVSTVLRLRVLQNVGSSLNAKRLSAFQGVPSFVLSRAFARCVCSVTEHRDFDKYRCGGRASSMRNETPSRNMLPDL